MPELKIISRPQKATLEDLNAPTLTVEDLAKENRIDPQLVTSKLQKFEQPFQEYYATLVRFDNNDDKFAFRVTNKINGEVEGIVYISKPIEA